MSKQNDENVVNKKQQKGYVYQGRIHKIFNLADDNVNSIFEKVFVCQKRVVDQLKGLMRDDVKVVGIVGEWGMIEKEIQKWGWYQNTRKNQKEQERQGFDVNKKYVKMPSDPSLLSTKFSLYILTILQDLKCEVESRVSTVFLLLPLSRNILLTKPYDQNSLIYLLVRFMGDLCNDIMVLYSEQVWDDFIENNNPYSIANGMIAQMSYKKRGLDDVVIREVQVEGWEEIKGGDWGWANGGSWVISSCSSMQKMRKVVQKSVRLGGEMMRERQRRLQVWVKLVKGDRIEVQVEGGCMPQQLRRLSQGCEQYLQGLHLGYLREIERFVGGCVGLMEEQMGMKGEGRGEMVGKVLMVVLEYYEKWKYRNGVYEERILFDKICGVLLDYGGFQQGVLYEMVERQFVDFVQSRNLLNEEYNKYLSDLMLCDGIRMLQFVIQADDEENCYFEVVRVGCNKLQRDGKVYGVIFNDEDVVKIGVEEIRKVCVNLKDFRIENVLVYKAKLVMQSMLALVSISYPSSQILGDGSKRVSQHIFILLDKTRPRQISRVGESQIFYTFNEICKKGYILLHEGNRLNTFGLDDFYRGYGQEKYEIGEIGLNKVISYSISYVKQQLFYYIDGNYELGCFNISKGKRNVVYTDLVYDEDGEDGEFRVGERVVFQGVDKKNGRYSVVQAFAFNGMLALGGCGRLDIFGVGGDGRLTLRKYIAVQEQFYLSTLVDDHNEYLTIYENLREKPRTLIFENMTYESFLKQTSKIKFQGNPILDIFYEAWRRFGGYTGYTCLKKLGGQKKQICLHHVIPEGGEQGKKNKIEKYLQMQNLEGHRNFYYFYGGSMKIYGVQGFGLVVGKQIFLREIQTRIPIQICSVDSGNLYPIRDGLYIDNFENKLSVAERSIKMRFGIAQILLGLQPDKKTVVVSVMGPQSLGKSYLLNRMFGTRFTVASCRTTIGIWISVVRLQKMNILVMDCQGLFSISRDFNEQQKLVKVLTSISDFTILNQGKGLTSKNLRELMKNLTSSLKEDGERSKQLYNGELIMVIRDVVAGENEQLIDEVKNTWVLPEMKNFLRGYFGGGDGFSINFLPSYLSTQDFSNKVLKLKETILMKGELLGRSSVMILKLLKIVLSQLAFDDGKKIKQFIDKINIEGLEQSFRGVWRKGLEGRVFSCEVIDGFIYSVKHRDVLIGENQFNVERVLVNQVFCVNLLYEDFRKNYVKSGKKINSQNFNKVYERFNLWLIGFFNQRYVDAVGVLQQEFKGFVQQSKNILYINSIQKMKKGVMKEREQLQLCLQVCNDCNLLCVKRKGHKKRVSKKRDDLKEEKRGYQEFLGGNLLREEEMGLDLRGLKERRDLWKREGIELKDICEVFEKIKKLQLDNSNGKMRICEIESKNKGIRKKLRDGGALSIYKEKVLKLYGLFELLQRMDGIFEQWVIRQGQVGVVEMKKRLERIVRESRLQEVILEIDNVRVVFENMVDNKGVVFGRFVGRRQGYEKQKREYEYEMKKYQEIGGKFQKLKKENDGRKGVMEKERMRSVQIEKEICRLTEQVKQLQKKVEEQVNEQQKKAKMFEGNHKKETVKGGIQELKERRNKIRILNSDRYKKICNILEQSRKQREQFLYCLRQFVILKHWSQKILEKGEKKEQKGNFGVEKLDQRIDKYLNNLQKEKIKPKNKANDEFKRQYFEESYSLNLLKEMGIELDRGYKKMQQKLKVLLDFFSYFNEERKVIENVFFYGSVFEFNENGAKQEVHVLNDLFQYREFQTFRKQEKRENSFREILVDFNKNEQQFLGCVLNSDSIDTQEQLQVKYKQLDENEGDEDFCNKILREIKILDFVVLCKKDVKRKFIGCLQFLLKRTKGRVSLEMIKKKVFERENRIDVDKNGEILCDIKMNLRKLKDYFGVVLKNVRVLTENDCSHSIKEYCSRYYSQKVQVMEQRLESFNQSFSSFDKYFTSVNEFWPSVQSENLFKIKFFNTWKQMVWDDSRESLQVFLKALLKAILENVERQLQSNNVLKRRLEQEDEEVSRMEEGLERLKRQRQDYEILKEERVEGMRMICQRIQENKKRISGFEKERDEQKKNEKLSEMHYQVYEKNFKQKQEQFYEQEKRFNLQRQKFEVCRCEYEILQKFSNEFSKMNIEELDILEINVKKQNKQRIELERRIGENELQIKKQEEKIVRKQGKILSFEGRVKNTDEVSANLCLNQKESSIAQLSVLIEKLEKHGRSKKTLAQISSKMKELEKCEQNKCSCLTDHNCDFACRINCQGQKCVKKAGHQGEQHLCNSKNHKCLQKCEVNENCENMCEQIMQHYGKHRCQSNHKCQNECNYCVKKCQKNLFDFHQKHECLQKKCMKKCVFCDKLCSNLDHGHDDYAQKIILKRKNVQTQIYEMKQYRFHICEDQHECLSSCVHEGTCSVLYKSEQKIWRKNQIETIYQYCQQTPTKNRCKLKIPIGKFKHEGACICTAIHTCTTRCPDCKGLCEKPFGHDESIPHETTHRNQESLIYAAENKNNDDFIQVQNQNSKFFFKVGDESLPFKCNESCKIKGRGHYHLIECKGGVNCFEKKYAKGVKHSTRVYYPHTDRNYDMVLCPYYWREYNFTMPYQNNEVTLCNFACTMEHSSNKMVFCSKETWHSMSNDRNEHKFDCSSQHKKLTVNGLEICFLIDATGSMKDYINECVQVIKRMVDASKRSMQKKNIKFAGVGYRDHKMTQSKLFKRLKELCLLRIQQLQGMELLEDYQIAQTSYSLFMEYISELESIYRSGLGDVDRGVEWSQKQSFILKYHYPFVLDVRSSRRFIDEREKKKRRKDRENKIVGVVEERQSLTSILLKRLYYYKQLIERQENEQVLKQDVWKLLEFVQFSGSQNCLNFFEGLKSCGGGDPPEAVVDGMNVAAGLNWSVNQNIRRYIFHILDAPPHGQEYDYDNQDYFPQGCPCGLKIEQVIGEINKKNINYIIYPLTKVRIKKTLQRFGEMGLKFQVKDIKNAKDFSEHAAGLICHQIEQKQILIKK